MWRAEAPFVILEAVKQLKWGLEISGSRGWAMWRPDLTDSGTFPLHEVFWDRKFLCIWWYKNVLLEVSRANQGRAGLILGSVRFPTPTSVVYTCLESK